jgi:hypothetical protein
MTEPKKKPKDQQGNPKPTQDKEHDPFSAFDNLFGQSDDQPLAHRPEEPEEPHPEQDQPHPEQDPRQRASQRDTQRAAGGAYNPRMGDLLNRMRDIEADPDDPGYPEPEQDNQVAHRVDNQNLPTIAGHALDVGGVQRPNFHKVANLPGNMSRSIRTLGRHLFRSLTSTPTDDIWMIANLAGQGPNSRQEVNAVAGWLRSHGEDLGDGNIDFAQSIPGYDADIHQYVAAGIRWLVVRDEFGDYIYSWPEQDSVDARNTRELGHERNHPRLGN